MKKRLLITGASGFLGFHLIEEAYKQGFEVIAAVRTNSEVQHLKHLNPKFVNLSFHNVDVLAKELENLNLDYIIHAAGSTKEKTLHAYNVVNADYTKNLALAACMSNIGLEKFIFISSLAAAGPQSNINARPILEQMQPSPITHYGKSKLLAEQFLQDIKLLPYIIFRPTAIYGPRERDLLVMLKSIQHGIEPYIGRKAQKFSFVFVKDVAEISIRALEQNVDGKIYNISDGNAYNRYEFAETAKFIFNNKTIKIHLPNGFIKMIASAMDLTHLWSEKTPLLNRQKLNEITAINWECSIEAIQKDLKYVPKYNLKSGMEETINWCKINNWL
jgi:nucleoside-diphosphate-sugar epimerase